MQRVAIFVLAALIGVAAPVRAWCEAACLAPVEPAGHAHCASHESTTTSLSISATAIDDCPVPDAARPTTIARLELKAALTTIESPHFSATFARAIAVRNTSPLPTVVKPHTPLRI